MADNIIDELDMLFNENMVEYSSRSNSLLDLPKEQMKKILKKLGVHMSLIKFQKLNLIQETNFLYSFKKLN